MYLRELFIKNSGPLRALQIEFAFAPEDRPIPYLIVGRNGTGKTNLSSIIADALMEGAANVYNDVLTSAGVGRNWFRVVGGKTTTYGEAGGLSILRFEHDGNQLFYRENAGEIASADAKAIVPQTLSDGVNWADNDKNGKTFTISEDFVRSIYQTGAHIFFPSSTTAVDRCHWFRVVCSGISGLGLGVFGAMLTRPGRRPRCAADVAAARRRGDEIR